MEPTVRVRSSWAGDSSQGARGTGAGRRERRMGAGLLTVAAVSLPWFFLVFRENGFAFVSFFFVNHNLVRYVSGIHHHSETFFYYVPMFLALFFPWSGWMAL